MTYTEAYVHIDNLLDKAGTGYFTDDEKNKFLDLATWEYTEYLVNTLESDAESMIKLAPLTRTETPSTMVPSGNAVFINLHEDTYHILSVSTVEGDYNVNIVSYNEFELAKKDPFHKPTIEAPIAVLQGSNFLRRLLMYGTTSSVVIQYIINPFTTYGNTTGIENWPHLGGFMERCSSEIVNIAVRKMMLSLEDPRYQLQANELSADKR